MALVLRGGGAVIWSQHQDAFPYIKGMLVVFLSWVVSPICSGQPLLLLCQSPVIDGHTDGIRCICLCSLPALPAVQILAAECSWCVSPGIIACVLFLVIRSLILRSPSGYKRAFFVRPPTLCCNPASCASSSLHVALVLCFPTYRCLRDLPKPW
jgi:hypothetical protein